MPWNINPSRGYHTIQQHHTKIEWCHTSSIVSQITGNWTGCSTACSSGKHRKRQSYVLLDPFSWIHRGALQSTSKAERVPLINSAEILPRCGPYNQRCTNSKYCHTRKTYTKNNHKTYSHGPDSRNDPLAIGSNTILWSWSADHIPQTPITIGSSYRENTKQFIGNWIMI